MSNELVSILVLALIFVIATFVPINIGALAFVAAFVLGSTVLGLAQDEILAGFPAGLAVTLIGITYLFAIAHKKAASARSVTPTSTRSARAGGPAGDRRADA